MKAKFKFSPGQSVTVSNGLVGKVAICGVTATGVQYLVRNDYHEQWTDEDQLNGGVAGQDEKPEADEA